MSVRALLERLLDIVGGSPEYFVTGSLSFLPLLSAYREPMHDVDVGIRVDLFQERRAAFETAGRVHVLRLYEVAVADRSRLARLAAPRTGFVHVDTDEGLIDLAQYGVREDSIEIFLGAGLTMRLPSTALERVRILEWRGLRYRAGPPELAILPKIVWYLAWRRSAAKPSADDEKHLLDLRETSSLVDWDYAESLVSGMSFHWLGGRIPRSVVRVLNPLQRLGLSRVRQELTGLGGRGVAAARHGAARRS